MSLHICEDSAIILEEDRMIIVDVDVKLMELSMSFVPRSICFCASGVVLPCRIGSYMEGRTCTEHRYIRWTIFCFGPHVVRDGRKRAQIIEVLDVFGKGNR